MKKIRKAQRRKEIKNIWIKRIVAFAVLIAMLISELPANFVEAETADRYPYTMFASSDDEGAITISARGMTLNGDLCTNGTLISTANVEILILH